MQIRSCLALSIELGSTFRERFKVECERKKVLIYIYIYHVMSCFLELC